MDFNRLCPGCMRERNNMAGKCPYCGYLAAEKPDNPKCLPVNTILAGKYLVGRVLGQGGFGITYIGFDLNMQTRVAIKEYFPVEVASRDTALSTGNRVFVLNEEKRGTYKRWQERFVTEARNIAKLADVPGVVAVKEFFYENDTAYIVMEYVDGMSLKEYLKKRGGELPEYEALIGIMLPVMEALKRVHEAGMIHRDLSPDNIMLTFDEKQRIKSAKLIDFGSARAVAQDEQQSRTIILKQGYAPEEQYRTNGEQGTWTDVYAISAVLYRMLTGEKPESSIDRMYKDEIKGFDRFPVKVRKNTQDAVMKGLAVRKESRPQTVEELAEMLFAEMPEVWPGLQAKQAAKAAKTVPRQQEEPKQQTSPKQQTPPPKQQQQQTPPNQRQTPSGQQNTQDQSWQQSQRHVPNQQSPPNQQQQTSPTQVKVKKAKNKRSLGYVFLRLILIFIVIEIIMRVLFSVGSGSSNSIFSNTGEIMVVQMTDENDTNVFGNSQIEKNDIIKIAFLDSLADIPDNAWDVSSKEDGSVMAWVTDSDNGMYELEIAGEGGVDANSDSSYMFAYYENVKKIEFNSCFDTSNVTNMAYMFYDCKSLTSLDISNFNTSKVTDMQGMFNDCHGLESLDLSSFDTHKVKDMSYMFSDCATLTNLDLDSFRTSKVTDMSWMFSRCEKLEVLNISSFDTDHVKDMKYMFYNCVSLIHLYTVSNGVSYFDTSGLIDGGSENMLYGCSEEIKDSMHVLYDIDINYN